MTLLEDCGEKVRQVTTKAKADSYWMTNKRTSNGNDKNYSNGKNYSNDKIQGSLHCALDDKLFSASVEMTFVDRVDIEFVEARQGKARQGKARQGKARQGKARQGKARQGKTRQDKTRQGRRLVFAASL
jgi:hypothetical protein